MKSLTHWSWSSFFNFLKLVFLMRWISSLKSCLYALTKLRINFAFSASTFSSCFFVDFFILCSRTMDIFVQKDTDTGRFPLNVMDCCSIHDSGTTYPSL